MEKLNQKEKEWIVEAIKAWIRGKNNEIFPTLPSDKEPLSRWFMGHEFESKKEIIGIYDKLLKC